SMHFCLGKAQQSLRSITGSTAGTFMNLTEQRIGRLCSNMDYTSIDNIIQQGLHQYIDGFQKQLNLVGEAIQDDFFTSHQSQQTQTTETSSQTQTS
ncbi:MAG: alpha-E domain-containing protein, partial [Planctomycetaceae bacterium]|nr:alpha-E domain-containing protein [Planctomycetaceae bacterium]